jgi:hypothetical protein
MMTARGMSRKDDCAGKACRSADKVFVGFGRPGVRKAFREPEPWIEEEGEQFARPFASGILRDRAFVRAAIASP